MRGVSIFLQDSHDNFRAEPLILRRFHIRHDEVDYATKIIAAPAFIVPEIKGDSFVQWPQVDKHPIRRFVVVRAKVDPISHGSYLPPTIQE